MTLVGQPPPSPALQEGYELLAQGKVADAEAVVRKAAVQAKKAHGSGSHPLAQGYGDLGRLHLRIGKVEWAAREFQHAAEGPMPEEIEPRRDRLAFLFGFGAALGDLGRLDEAEKVLRRCLAFAQNLNGPQSASAFVALVPLADVLLKMGKTAPAAKLAAEAYDALWQLGDPQFALSVGTRAETLKATGRTDNAFLELADLPEDMVIAAVANVMTRAGKGDTVRVRAVLVDLLGFVDKKFGDNHTLTRDTLAAMVHHEAAAGAVRADEKIRKMAVRRSVWSFAIPKLPIGLLANLEVMFEANGTIHIAPHLSREPSPEESAQIEAVLNEAVDDIYSRPAPR